MIPAMFGPQQRNAGCPGCGPRLTPSGSAAAAVALALLLGALSGAVLAREVAPQETPEEDAELDEGRQLFGEQCQPCHGAGGKGDGPAARFLNPKPQDLTDGVWEYAADGSLEAVIRVVRDGVDNTGMTPFGKVLTEEEIRAVSRFVVEVLAKPKPESSF